MVVGGSLADGFEPGQQLAFAKSAGGSREGRNARMANRFRARDFGPLPVDLINATIGTELEPGVVRLSAAAHRHIAEDHPNDYAACMSALPLALAAPSFIGQAPGHSRNFEIVRRTHRPDGRAVLVAISLDRDEAGFYRIRSCYLITAEAVDARRHAGRLKAPIPRKD